MYRGVDQSLVGATSDSSLYYHGKDGLGDVPDQNAPDLTRIRSEHAVLALIRLANQHPGNSDAGWRQGAPKCGEGQLL